MRAAKHLQYGLLDPQRKEKKIKLFTRESSQQAKEEHEIFLGFLLIITTTSMEIKLIKSCNYFFVFLKIYQTHKKKVKKKIKLTWIIQRKSMSTDD